MPKFTGYCLLCLEIGYAAWEWMFLMTAAFFLTSVAHGGIISGTLFLTMASTRIVLAQSIAVQLEKYPAVKKIRIGLGARCGLFAMAIGLFFLQEAQSYVFIFWMRGAAFLFMIDGYASIDFRYILSQNAHFSFARIAAFLNIGKRGTIAILSVLAVQMMRGDWGTLSGMLCILIFLGIVSLACLLFMVQQKPTFLSSKHSSLSKESLVDESKARVSLHIHALALYLFAFNLFFGANSLMVMKAMTIYPLALYTVNPLTVFYTSFVAANIMTMAYPQLAERFSNWKSISVLFALTALFCMSYWLFRQQVILFMLAALFFGLTYAIQTTCIFVKLYQTIRGRNQTTHLARIDTVSKCGFIVSQISVGLLLDAGVDPLVLSAVFGLSALLAFSIYFIWWNKFRLLDM